MSDSDPIRAMAAARRPPTYRLPAYIRPRFPDPAPTPIEALTPGAGARTDPAVADVFTSFIRDQLGGAYGSTSGWH
jgi:hypothetical protein